MDIFRSYEASCRLLKVANASFEGWGKVRGGERERGEGRRREKERAISLNRASICYDVRSD